MHKSMKRRVLGVLSVVLATQLLSACIVLPVPAHRSRAVVVSPGYGYPGTPYRDPYWRR
ncbi:MAG: hypothetical protein ABI605_07970 [Rhizobacter sp.]